MGFGSRFRTDTARFYTNTLSKEDEMEIKKIATVVSDDTGNTKKARTENAQPLHGS